MKNDKLSNVRTLSKVKDNEEFAKCFAVVSAAGEKSELFAALTASQIAALIDSIYDRTIVTNWIIDTKCSNGFNPAYTKNGRPSI